MNKESLNRRSKLLSLKRISKIAEDTVVSDDEANEQDLLQLEEKRIIFEALPDKKKYEAILEARLKGEPVYDWMKLPYWDTLNDKENVALLKEVARTFDFETCKIISNNPHDILNEAATIFCKFYKNTYGNSDRITDTVYAVFFALNDLMESDHPCFGAGRKKYGPFNRSGLDLWISDLIGIVADWQDELRARAILDDPNMPAEQRMEALKQFENRNSSIPMCNMA